MANVARPTRLSPVDRHGLRPDAKPAQVRDDAAGACRSELAHDDEGQDRPASAMTSRVRRSGALAAMKAVCE